MLLFHRKFAPLRDVVKFLSRANFQFEKQLGRDYDSVIRIEYSFKVLTWLNIAEILVEH